MAALGLLAAVIAREEGADLRSRCQLIPTEDFESELLGQPGSDPKKYKVDAQTAISLFNQAVEHAKGKKLPWESEVILTPHTDLITLVSRSQQKEANSEEEESDDVRLMHQLPEWLGNGGC